METNKNTSLPHTHSSHTLRKPHKKKSTPPPPTFPPNHGLCTIFFCLISSLLDLTTKTKFFLSFFFCSFQFRDHGNGTERPISTLRSVTQIVDVSNTTLRLNNNTRGFSLDLFANPNVHFYQQQKKNISTTKKKHKPQQQFLFLLSFCLQQIDSVYNNQDDHGWGGRDWMELFRCFACLHGLPVNFFLHLAGLEEKEEGYTFTCISLLVTKLFLMMIRNESSFFGQF